MRKYVLLQGATEITELVGHVNNFIALSGRSDSQ